MERNGPAAGTPPEPGALRGPRLFVFPHAGGWSLLFRQWPDRFPPDWRVRALDAPGHGALLDSPPLADGEALLSYYLDLIAPEIADARTPFAFFGHSMGSLVAYELTRRLLARGMATPVWLGVSAFGFPGTGDGPGPLLDPGLSDDALRRLLGSLGGTPPEVLADPHLWTVFAPAVRADLAVLRDLRAVPAGPPLPVALSAFAGADDEAAPPARVASWAGRTERFLGLRVLNGGHFYFQDSLDDLAARVTADVRGELRARLTPVR